MSRAVIGEVTLPVRGVAAQDVVGERERMRREVVPEYALAAIAIASEIVELAFKLLAEAHRACELPHLL